MSSNDLNLLKAITEKREEKYLWEARNSVRRILDILRETPEGNPMWQPVYDAIVVEYGLLADWGDDQPPTSADPSSAHENGSEA